MKKLLSILLAMCMLFAMFALPAAAAEEVTCILHIGDTTQQISGAVGNVIKFPMPFSEAAAMGKHFVTWCTDEACENPLTEDVKFASGETVHYYAWLKDFATYYKEDFDSVKNADTVIQYAHDQSGNDSYYGYTMPLYNSAVTPGTGVAISKASGWYEQHIFLKDADGTYVTAAPNTTYHMTIKYRVTAVGDNGKITIYPVYGINTQYVGRTDMRNQHSASKTGSALATIKAVSADWVTQEVDFTTGDVLMDGFNKWVPNIGFRLFNETGSTTTEIDYIEVERYKTVKFEYLYAADATQELLKDDAIEYPALEDGTKWSLSKSEYIPVPETMGEKDLTVYEYDENQQNLVFHNVTFINSDGTESQKEFIEGKKIAYPALTPADYNKADIAWSLSKDKYIAAPEVMGTEDITVYEYANPVMSFENYNHSYSGAVTNDWLDNAMITDEMAFSGNYSMRYRNYNLKALTSEPNDWASNYTSYYKYDEDADKFVLIDDETAPTFVAGKFYKYRESYQLNQGTFFTPIYLGSTADGPYSYDYKLSLKYYVPEGNTAGIKITAYHINTDSVFFTGTQTVSDTYTIPATATGGWQTLTMDIYARELVVDAAGAYKYGGQAIVLKVDTASATGANAANVTVYFDDINCENVGRSSVTFVEGKFETTVFGDKGTAIEYPKLSGNAKWSLSKDEYIAVPETFDGRVTVYIYGENTFVYGDCDGNGEVNIDDLAALKLHLAGIGEVEAGADCDGSGEVNIDDLAALKLYLAGVSDLEGEGTIEPPTETETVITNMGIPTDYLTNTAARPIWDMMLWDGKLYIGNGDYNASTGPLPIMAYNLEKGEWENTGEVFGEEIARFVVVNGELVIPDIDPRDYNNLGNYYVLRDGVWKKYRNVTSGEHVYDMISYDGKVFGGVGTSETLCPTSPICVSTDNGVKFTLVDCSKNGKVIDFKEEWYFTRCHELFTINDELYALIFFYDEDSKSTREIYKYNNDLGIFEYLKSGNEFYKYYQRKTSMIITSKGEFNGNFYYVTDYLYSGNDINALRKVELPEDEYVARHIVRDGKMYILAYTYNEVKGKYITRVYETSEGTNAFTKLIEFEFDIAPVSIEKDGNDFYIGMGGFPAGTYVKNDLNGTLLKVTI